MPVPLVTSTLAAHRVLDLQHPGRRVQGSAGPAPAPPTVLRLQVRRAAADGPTRVRSSLSSPRPVRGPPPRGEGTSFPPNPRSIRRAAARVRFFLLRRPLCPAQVQVQTPRPGRHAELVVHGVWRPGPRLPAGQGGWGGGAETPKPLRSPGEAPRPRGGLAAGAGAAHPGERGAPASPASRTAPASPARAPPRREDHARAVGAGGPASRPAALRRPERAAVAAAATACGATRSSALSPRGRRGGGSRRRGPRQARPPAGGAAGSGRGGGAADGGPRRAPALGPRDRAATARAGPEERPRRRRADRGYERDF